MPATACARSLGKDVSAPVNERAHEQAPLAAPGSLGFSLAGVVMADDPALQLAIIDHLEEGEQRSYREGDRADGVLIKRILRDEVVVDTGEGERRLQLQHTPTTVGPPVALASEPGRRAQQDVSADRPIHGRRTTVHLNHHEVATALAQVNRVLQQVDLSPVTRFERPTGFRITNIPAGGILSRLGLRDGDIIKRIDDAELTHPEEAADLLRIIRKGGNHTLTVTKRRRTRQIVLNIQ